MKINFVLPYNTWGGAFRSTYELANHLAARGEDVEINIPFFPYLEGYDIRSWKGLAIGLQGLARSVIRRNKLPWFDLKVPLRVIPVCKDPFVRDADIVIANHWPTAFSVAGLSPSKGRKFYFIRDADSWGPHYEQEVLACKLPLTKIVVSSWLKDYLESEIGVEVKGVVCNGLNFNNFYVDSKKYNQTPVVCMMYVEHPAKGMEEGFSVLRAVKEKHPHVKVISFGWKKPKYLPVEAEFHWRPVKEKLRAVYAQSDIFIWPSLREGFGNPPQEAMAAGCAVVATNTGCIPHRTIPGETALVVEPGDIGGMTRAICNLIEHPQRIAELGRCARDHIQQFTWGKAAAQLLELLR